MADQTTHRANTPDTPFVGRSDEFARFEAVARLVSEGGAAFVGISGRAGSGKTALMRQLADKQGSDIRAYGKYELVKTRPYEGIATALGDLLAQMDSKSEPGWEEELRNVIGSEGASVLRGLSADLARILESEDRPATMDPEVMLARLRQSVLHLVEYATDLGISISLMFDDLQWAGTNSLSLIELLAERQYPGLLILGAWRSNVEELNSPFADDGVLTEGFRLGGLDEVEISQLFQELAGSQPDPHLATALAEETRGNPQFLSELVRSELSEGLLKVDPRTGKWSRERDTMAEADLAEGLARILSRRLDQLPAAEADIISTAASLGTPFSLTDVAAAAEAPLNTVSKAVLSPSARSLVVAATREGGVARYRFAHDRIAELAASRLTTKQRQEARLRLGQYLLENEENRLSDAVIHITAGADLLTTAEDRLALAANALRAGRRAASRAAFSIAFEHYSSGCRMLSDPSEPGQFDLRRRLRMARAEAAWLVGDDSLDELIDDALAEVGLTKAEKARLVAIRMKVHLGRGERDEALKLGRDVLGEFGIKLPDRPTRLGLIAPLLRMKLKLRRLDEDALLSQPVSSDESAIYDEPVLVEMFSTSYIGDLDLFPFVVLRAVDLTLQRGRLPMSPVAFAGYGLLSVVLGDYEGGRRYGELAMKLAEAEESARYRPWTAFQYYNFIHHWWHPMSSGIEPIRQAQDEATAVGDPTYGAYLADVEIGHLLAMGTPLPTIEQRGWQLLRQMRAGQEKQREICAAVLQVALNLTSPGLEDPTLMSGESGYRQQEIERRIQEETEHGQPEDLVSLAILRNSRLVLAMLSGLYDRCAGLADDTAEYLDGLIGTTFVPVFHFANAFGRVMSRPEDPQTRRHLEKALGEFDKWGRMSEENYGAQRLILGAQRQWIKGDGPGALTKISKASELGKRAGLTNYVAFAHEAAAQIAGKQGDAENRDRHIREAREAWSRLGNTSRLDRLSHEHPRLAPEPEPQLQIDPRLQDVFGKLTGLEDGRTALSRTAVTVLAADIRKYAEHSLQPLGEGVVKALVRRFWEETRTIIATHGGIAIEGPRGLVLGLFQDSAANALSAALAIHSSVDDENRAAERRGDEPIPVGIGLSHGEVTLSVAEDEGTVLGGPAVEEATELEASNLGRDSSLRVGASVRELLALDDRIQRAAVEEIPAGAGSVDTYVVI